MVISILSDLDGVLIEHGSDYLPLPGAVAAVEQWHKNGMVVVIVTAREAVDEKKIKSLFGPVHKIVCGLGSGPRVLINDRKPYLPGADMAIAVNTERNACFESYVCEWASPKARAASPVLQQA